MAPPVADIVYELGRASAEAERARDQRTNNGSNGVSRASSSERLRSIAILGREGAGLDMLAIGVFEHGVLNEPAATTAAGPWSTDQSAVFAEQARWANEDRVLARRLAMLPHGRLYRRSELIDESDFRRTRLYNEFQRPIGMGDQALGLFHGPDGTEVLLSFALIDDHGPIPEPAFSSAATLMPYVARAALGVFACDASSSKPTGIASSIEAMPPGASQRWEEPVRVLSMTPLSGDGGPHAPTSAPAPSAPAWAAHLRPPSRAVLSLVLNGLDDQQIAQHTGLTYHAVRGHIKRLFRAAGVRSRLHLMQAFRGAGALTN